MAEQRRLLDRSFTHWVGNPRPLPAILVGLVLTIGAVLVLEFWPGPHGSNIYSAPLVFLISVVVTATLGGWRAGMCVALIAAAAWNWFFLPPVHSLGASPACWFTLGAFLAVATLVGQVPRFVQSATENERIAEVVQQSEERYRAFFDLNAVGASETRLPGGEFIRVNDALCKMTGYSREELLTMRFSDLSHPEEVEASIEHFRRLGHGKLPHYSRDKRYIRKDGGTIWVHLEVTEGPRNNGRREYAISVVQDITDQRYASEALQDANERYRLATSAGRILVWEWDADTDTTFIESRFPSDIMPDRMTVAEFGVAVHPDDRDRVLSTWRSATSGSVDRAELEYWVVEEDGSIGWLHTRYRISRRRAGQVQRILGVSVDVTERRDVEERLRLSEERYRAFFERSVVGASEVDLANPQYLRVNDAYCQMLGYTRRANASKHWRGPGGGNQYPRRP